jgi:hypothetical protein
LFESIKADDAAARLRGAAVPPLAAFLLALFYLTIYPMLGRVPAPLFWAIVAIELAGALGGAVMIARVATRERIRGRALGWAAIAGLITLACAWLFVSMAVPWL